MKLQILGPRGHVAALFLAASVAMPAGGAAQASSGRPGLTLQDVISASAAHPLVSSARARVEAARGSRNSAGTLPNPIAAYQIENAPFPGRAGSSGVEREASTTLTLPLESLYQRGPRIRWTDAGIRAAEADVITVRRGIAIDALRAFYRVALAQLAVRGAFETREGLARLLSYNMKRVAEGVAPEGELLRVQLEHDRAATAVALARAELERSRALLGSYLPHSTQEAWGDSLRVDAETEMARHPVPPLAQLIARARQCRPELATARARLAAAEAETDLQRSLTIRQVGATIGQKRVGLRTSMIAGLSMPLPLFDRNRGEIRRSNADRVVAEKELEWSERSLIAELAGSHRAALLISAEVARLGSSFLNRAEEIRRITLAAYEDGAASLLQVLDASRALNDARLAYYNALFSEQQNLLELYTASGMDPDGSFSEAAGGSCSVNSLFGAKE